MFQTKSIQQKILNNIVKVMLGLIIVLCFAMALLSFIIDELSNQKSTVYLDYGGPLRPETNHIHIYINEFSHGAFLANASFTIGRNRLLEIASQSDEIILILHDVTSALMDQRAYPLMLKSKSSNAAFFQSTDKIKIPASGNPTLYPFDTYLIAVLPIYMMNDIGYNLPNKASMALKLPQHLKTKSIRKLKIDRSSFSSLDGKQIECSLGCGIEDNIFVFKVSYSWWYRWAIIGLLICLLIPLYAVWKTNSLSTSSELLTLILSVVALRTFILGYQTGQIFLLDFYFAIYFVVWLFVQLFRINEGKNKYNVIETGEKPPEDTKP